MASRKVTPTRSHQGWLTPQLGPLELTMIHYPFTVLGFVAPVTDWEIPPLVRADIAPRCTMPILLCLSSRPSFDRMSFVCTRRLMTVTIGVALAALTWSANAFADYTEHGYIT